MFIGHRITSVHYGPDLFSSQWLYSPRSSSIGIIFLGITGLGLRHNSLCQAMESGLTFTYSSASLISTYRTASSRRNFHE